MSVFALALTCCCLQVAALQRLQAQLSYLRHPFSPAAAAALAAVPIGTLPWLTGLFGHAKLGLAVQWRTMVAVLPFVAGVLRALSKLGVGARAQQQGSGLPSASHTGSNNSASIESAAGMAAAATAAAGAVGLSDLVDAVQPCGASFMAFLHTTCMPFTAVWRLLHVAPLLLVVLWGLGVWAAMQAVRWSVWAFNVWGISWAGA